MVVGLHVALRITANYATSYVPPPVGAFWGVSKK